MNERLYPAALCNIATRVVRLRNKMETFPPHIQKELEEFVRLLPFEKELLSGVMEKVEEAIAGIGRYYPDAEERLVKEIVTFRRANPK